MPQDLPAPVLRNLDLGHGNFLLELHAPAQAAAVEAGQFFMLGVPGAEILLRRPFSVCGARDTFPDAPAGALQILYKIVGKGTALMASLRAGATVQTLGPLGHGFHPPAADALPVFVAGGIGSAPFPALAKSLRGQARVPWMLYGARTAADLPLLDWFREHCERVEVTTEDGSLGRQGRVTAPLEELLAASAPGSLQIYACGPNPMLAAVARLTRAHGMPCDLSLEAPMACGFGVCLGCVVPCHAEDGGTRFERVCLEGPILRAERLGVVTDLTVDVGRLRLKNPVLTASGTFGYGLEFLPFLDLPALGGFVTKGLSPRPRRGATPPRIAETPSGMLNAIGLQNVGVDAFLTEKLPALRAYDTAVVANVFGETVSEYVEVCAKLDGAPGLAGVELNVSCPNVECGGMVFGQDPVALADVTRACRRATRLPLWVKLSPNVTDIREFAKAAEGEGADAVSLVNTFVGMAVDVERRRPVLANGSGGLSGPAIRPLAVWMTWQVYRAVKIPIVGIGGILTGHDALEFLLAGATAVQVGTANFIRPDAAVQVVREIEAYMVAHEIASIRELTGALQAGVPR